MSIYIDKILSTIPKEEHKLNEYLQYITQEDIVKSTKSLYSDIASIVCEYLYLYPINLDLIKFSTIEKMGRIVPTIIQLKSNIKNTWDLNPDSRDESIELHYDYIRPNYPLFVFKTLIYKQGNTTIKITYKHSYRGATEGGIPHVKNYYIMNIKETNDSKIEQKIIILYYCIEPKDKQVTADGEHIYFTVKRDLHFTAGHIYFTKGHIYFTGKNFDLVGYYHNDPTRLKIVSYLRRIYELCQCFGIPLLYCEIFKPISQP